MSSVELQFLQEFVDEINLTNSNLDKQAVVKKYYERDSQLFSQLMNYVYDYHYKYYLTSANVLKREDLVNENQATYNLTIFNMLDMLYSRTETGHNAISLVNTFIKDHSEYKELVLRMLDKDLKCRIDAKTINKVIPNLIPTFDVSLGEKFDAKRFNWEDETWYASRKLDGIRCIFQKNVLKFYSRQGEEFWVLDVLKDAIKNINELNGYVLDGELSLITEDGSDDFQGIMKQIRRKDHTIPNIRLNVFDMLTQEEFDSKTSLRTFSERYSKLLEIKDILESTGHIKIVEQFKIESTDLFESLKQKALENNWEGLMLRKDDVYKGKRSFDLLKVKQMESKEFKVLDVVYGKMPILIDGIMKETDVVSSIIIDLGNTFTCECGSGFTIEERLDFYKDSSKIIGHNVTVNYFEETTDQNGKKSLRFPIYKGIRDELI